MLLLLFPLLVSCDNFIELTENHPGVGYSTPDLLQFARVEEFESTADQISRFSSALNRTFEFNFEKLPQQGRVARDPWPGSYYPAYQGTLNLILDGINARPTSQYSAVEKYAWAFGQDPRALSDRVSAVAGIDKFTSRPSCYYDSQCRSDEVCAIRSGRRYGKCIPGWFGICHAWAPAAIQQPEPKCPVYLNRVKFSITDIKALMTQMYDKSGIKTVFAAGRCNDYDPAQDQYGNYRKPECRDIQPDLFYLMMTNMVGIYRRSLVADVDATAPVWNQPVHSYRVAKTFAISHQDAQKYISTSSFNPDSSLVYMQFNFWYTVEGIPQVPVANTSYYSRYVKPKQYEFILELDSARNVVGGEWIRDAGTDHVDFMWMPVSQPSPDYSVAGIEYSKVKMLLQKSVSCESASLVRKSCDYYETKALKKLCLKGLLPQKSIDGCLGCSGLLD